MQEVEALAGRFRGALTLASIAKWVLTINVGVGLGGLLLSTIPRWLTIAGWTGVIVGWGMAIHASRIMVRVNRRLDELCNRL